MKEEWKNSLLVHFYEEDVIEGLIPPKPKDKNTLIKTIELCRVQDGHIGILPKTKIILESPTEYGKCFLKTIKVLNVNTGIQQTVGMSFSIKDHTLDFTHTNSETLIRLIPSNLYHFKIDYYFDKGYRYTLKEKN